MKTYLVFFGNSQGFLSYFYDNTEFIQDFDIVIKDFNLLESRVFSVDSVDNKEILSRYSFIDKQGKQYSLMKLYSFAQAYNIPRIEGCLFGVGIISDSLVSFSSKNLNLLKVAKDNFSKLSLNGLKFNKSDFLNDSTKIWKAIVQNESGNLIESIDLEPSQFKNQEKIVAFNVANLFQDPVGLNIHSKNFDIVYFSEDLQHLKRAQQKSGADNFSIYVKENDKYILYKEPVKEIPKQVLNDLASDHFNRDAKQVRENYLEVLQKETQIIKVKLKETEKKSVKKSKIIILIALLLVLISIVAFFWIHNLRKKIDTQSKTLQELSKAGTLNEVSTSGSERFSFLGSLHSNVGYYDTLALLAKDLKYIADFNPQKSFSDSAKFISRFQNLKRRSLFLGIGDLGEFEIKYANSIQSIRDSVTKENKNSSKKLRNR